MPYALDPEYLASLAPLLPVLSKAVKPPEGDIASRRAGVDGLWDLVEPRWPSSPDVTHTQTTIRATDGHDIPVHIFQKTSSTSSSPSTPTPGALYIHGGGFFALSPTHYQKVISKICSLSSITLIAPAYRKAPEHPFPVPFTDCHTVLKWLHSTSGASAGLNIDPARIGVYGDSAGGAIAAGLAIKARDDNLSPPLKMQFVCAGMIDDRTTALSFPETHGIATWAEVDNVTGWGAYLGKDNVNMPDGHERVSLYACPGRLKPGETKGLPDAYVEVTACEIFRDENLRFARTLDGDGEGRAVEVHVWPGVPHSFEVFAPHITITELALRCRAAALRRL